MAQQTLLGGDGVTGESGATHNSKANSNFTELYGAVAAAQADADAAQSDISTHISANPAHIADNISVTPFGTIGATNVQDALEEIATEAGAAVPDASTTVKGIAELLTDSEARTGTDATRAATAANLTAVVYGDAKTGTAIAFTDNAIYGTVSSPITGNITANQTSAKVGCKVTIVHNHSSEPTFDSNYKLMFGNYQINKVNFIECEYMQSNYIRYSISYVA